jgi:hypothetical protein
MDFIEAIMKETSIGSITGAIVLVFSQLNSTGSTDLYWKVRGRMASRKRPEYVLITRSENGKFTLVT